MSSFYEGMADILEMDPAEVSSSTPLDESVWDSLAFVSTIALIDEVYDKSISADALAECKTVGDIEQAVAAA